MNDGSRNGWGGESSELQKTLTAGIHGTPVLKRDEKAHYLGEFRERVIKVLTKRQIMEPQVYAEIEEALRHPQAAKMIIDGRLDDRFTEKYEKLAIQAHRPFQVRSDSDFKGEVGLVIVSDRAVDIKDIAVEDREDRLKRLGLPEELIHARGKKVCDVCYNQVAKLAPEEKKHYGRISGLGRVLLGEHCPVPHKAMKK